ncbi:GntR family transcriptional regulator [Leifsonia sp. NPDC058248]|uniref:GntR family transcriptional regulator n=1 Tax=Leifsonia sp. NPDC058248 TaxID=3346402 RepID=UPI0036DA37FB
MPIPDSSRAPLPAREMLRDTVERRIHEAIMDGSFEPGEILHDKELQDWLGVSRTPIRDALNELTRAGLVEMSANRYTRVAGPSDEDAGALLRSLGVIFGGAARLAVPVLSDEGRASVVAAIDSVLEAVAATDADAYSRRRGRLFRLFVTNCGNEPLLKLARENVDGLTFRMRVARNRMEPDWEALHDEYGRLRAATDSRDAVAAELATGAIHGLPR